MSFSENLVQTYTTGKVIRSMPTQTQPHENIPFQKAYKHRQTIMAQFERRWKSEYLASLQTPRSHKRITPPIQVGQLVFIKPGEKLSKQKWPLARVVETHPGPDNIVRVVTLRTRNGLIKRGVNHVFHLEEDLDVERQTKTNEEPEAPANLDTTVDSVQPEDDVLLPNIETVRDETKPNSTQNQELKGPEMQVTRRGRTVRKPARYSLSLVGLALLGLYFGACLAQSHDSDGNDNLQTSSIEASDNSRVEELPPFEITPIIKPYMLEEIGKVYQGLTVGHLIFTIPMSDLISLTRAVNEHCLKFKYTQRKWPDIETRTKNVGKLLATEAKCFAMVKRMEIEDASIHAWLNLNENHREKRFMASLGALVVGGALTYAAEGIAHLFSSSSTYNNEKLLAEHIKKTEQEVHHLGVLDNHFKEALEHSQKLIEQEFTAEKVDIFILRIEQVIEKLVEDHRTLVHQLQDLIVNVLHPGLFSMNAIEQAINNFNERLTGQGKRILLNDPVDIFHLPFTIIKEQQATTIVIHVPLGTPGNVMTLFKVHTLPFSLGSQGAVTQLK